MKYECKIQGGTWGEVEAVSARDAAVRVAQRERTVGMIRVVPATGDASTWWSDGEGGLIPMSHYIGDGVYAHADADGTLTLSTQRGDRFEHIVMTRDMLRDAIECVRIVRARVAPMPKVVACNELADGEMYFIDSKHLAAPSEASAIAVLREWVGWMDVGVAPRGTLDAILARARSVLAASGPDPMPVVRAAMEWRYGRRGDTGPMNTLAEAVETYRKDGGE